MQALVFQPVVASDSVIIAIKKDRRNYMFLLSAKAFCSHLADAESATASRIWIICATEVPALGDIIRPRHAHEVGRPCDHARRFSTDMLSLPETCNFSFVLIRNTLNQITMRKTHVTAFA